MDNRVANLEVNFDSRKVCEMHNVDCILKSVGNKHTSQSLSTSNMLEVSTYCSLLKNSTRDIEGGRNVSRTVTTLSWDSRGPFTLKFLI